MTVLEQNQPHIEDRAQVAGHPSSQGGVQQRVQVVTVPARHFCQAWLGMLVLRMRVPVVRYAMVRMRLCPTVLDGVRQR